MKVMLLLLSNKILSGFLAMMGYAPCGDNDEVDSIVPMYGMPSSVYRPRKKAGAVKKAAPALSLPQLTITPVSHAV